MSELLSALDGRVELKGVLGEGGMGEVHRAWDKLLDRAVAVKFVWANDAQDTERLLLEARLQARVEHPHVVKVHQVGTLGGRPCIVLQLVEGRTLAELASTLSLQAKVELVRQAGLGLHAAHLQGLVHRDVKPANVLVEQAPAPAATALLTDFGLARAEDAGLSRSGLPPGTLDFMSPEQLVAPGPVDFRSDIYALGATLYAVLAGRPPFRTTSSEASTDKAADVQLMRRILEEEPEPLTHAAEGAPRELALIAARAMEKQPAARYPSAEAFSEDLGRFQRGEPILAKPASWMEQARKWARRNRAAARALGIAALALLFTGVWTLWVARRADAAALEAARLGALSESMEAQLRMEQLGPPHDLRPSLERIRGEVDRLRPLAAQGGGPANLALGKALQLSGELEGARAAYETAWKAGFRTPRVAEGLGIVLGELYRRGYERARETLTPEARGVRVAALQAELREPAERYLKLSDTTGWRARYLQASVAMLEGDFAQARTHAGAVLETEPGRYEALTLSAVAWLEEARELANAGRFDEGEAAVGQAAGPIEGAGRWGRSDPSVAKARAQLHLVRSNMLMVRGQSPEPEIQATLAAITQASVLNPDDASLEALRGTVLMQRGQYLFLANNAEVLSVLEEAAAAYRRAVQLGGADVKTLCNLGRCSYYRATKLNLGGKPSLDAVQEGLAAADRAAEKAPRDAEVPFLRCLLHRAEASALQREGKPSANALRAAVESGERALASQAAKANLLRPIIGESLTLLARQNWLEGKDPRPGFEHAYQVLREAVLGMPGQPSVVGQLAFSVDTEASVLWALGVDPRAHVEEAVARVDEILSRTPGLLPIQAVKGELLAAEGLRRAEAGEDPTPILTQATRSLERAAPGSKGDVGVVVSRGIVGLAEAHWQAAHGADPRPLLARAETDVAALGETSIAPVAEFLARCARARARWLRQHGQAAEDEAKRGLAYLETALESEPRDAELWVLKARLQALASQQVAAEQSFERASTFNPLVKGGLAGREAQAELHRG
jgi:eukaryotic-like serine/threonine-protein kinase